MRNFFVRLSASALLLGFCGALYAAPPSDYYDTITGQTGEALKQELQAIVSGQRGYPVNNLSYNAARDALLASVDNVGSGNVRLIYTGEERSQSQWAVSINREHVWPQSFGASVSPKRSDLHHLFLCDSSINSSRGNDLFGNVTGGTIVNPGDPVQFQIRRDDGVWQVGTAHRGDVARAILFMDTRYSDFNLFSRGESQGSQEMGYLDDLLEWHEDDPPTDPFEIERNDRVFAFQNNRNPYIDNSSYVTLVYGAAGSSGPDIANFSISNGLPDASVSPLISADVTDTDGITLVELSYRTGGSGAYTSVAMTNSSGDTYEASIPAQSEGTLVEYYIRAQDSVSDESFFPVSFDINPLNYTVAGDNPIITKVSFTPSSVDDTSTVNILADVQDDDGNGAGNLTVTAFWRVAGETTFTSIPMSILSGTLWSTNTDIPAQPADTTIEYYVAATDSGSGAATFPVNAPSGVSSYFVEEVGDYILIDDVSDALGDLVITEFAHRVSGSGVTEFLEIVNLSQTQGYQLDNIYITDNDQADSPSNEAVIKFPNGVLINPGGIIVVFPRLNPEQSYINTIPTVSNRNGAGVQVFVTNGSGLLFNGDQVPQMVLLAGGDLQFATGGDNIQIYVGTGTSFTDADVLDGLGYGTPSGGPDPTIWGPGVENTINLSGATDGGFRLTPTDTDSRNDWQGVSSAALTPGELPAAFELDRIQLDIASNPNYTPGSPNLFVLNEGASDSLQVRLDEDPGRTVSLTVAATGGTDSAANFQVLGSAAITFNSSNWNVYQTITFEKTIDTDTTNDEADFEFTGALIESLAFTAQEVDTLIPVELDQFLVD